MEGFTGLIIGAALGVGGMIAKDKLAGQNQASGTSSNKLNSEAEALSDENEKLRKRNREAERRIDDLMAENEKLRRQFKDKDDDQDDLEDDLAKAKAEVKKLRAQNDELLRKIQEYKLVCDSYENEINNLKNK